MKYPEQRDPVAPDSPILFHIGWFGG
jgi:hypothetical protein